jgi:deazaflavin-dependent oxidoreductase (nitroreductase family)
MAADDELWLRNYSDRDCCDVVTRGRRSGRTHVVELWFGVINASVYFISGNGKSADWFANMVAHPEVEVRFGEDRRIGRARVVSSLDERRQLGDLMGAKYDWDGDDDIDLSRQAWCYDVPAIAIDDWKPKSGT